jgi:hypothetical protein
MRFKTSCESALVYSDRVNTVSFGSDLCSALSVAGFLDFFLQICRKLPDFVGFVDERDVVINNHPQNAY